MLTVNGAPPQPSRRFSHLRRWLNPALPGMRSRHLVSRVHSSSATQTFNVSWFWGRTGWVALFCLFVLGIAAWLGYHAAHNWAESENRYIQRVNDRRMWDVERGLVETMRAAHLSVFHSVHPSELVPRLPDDLGQRLARAFDEFPQIEEFFVWRPVARSDVLIYARNSRRPSWGQVDTTTTLDAVGLVRNAGVGNQLSEWITRDVLQGRRFSCFDLELDTAKYQIVALVSYAGDLGRRPEAVFGFMVNVDWVQTHHLPELLRKFARDYEDVEMVFGVFNKDRQLIAGREPLRGPGAALRQIPVMFFHPSTVGSFHDRVFDVWTLEANVAPGSSRPLLNRTQSVVADILGITVIAIFVLVVGCLLAIQATRTRAELATVRAEFVAAVTHELRTPIATIRMIGETIASGRSPGPEGLHRYARITVREAKRLGRLIDNLLAYARLTDIADAYSVDAIEVRSMIDESIKQFANQLTDGQFDVRVDIASDLPPIQADRSALQLVLTNLIDNAIRYSIDQRFLRINVERNNGHVVLEVADSGKGIPEDEIPFVTERFFRGRNAGSGGSGLGLAIVNRIVSDHGGTLDIESDKDEGTTVKVCLPITREI